MRKASSPLVSRVAEDLRNQAFAAAAGTYLGSEAELLEQFKISRPTFRQAAKVVEQEQLVVIKPGARGGYFVRRPDSVAVAHMTSVYLRSRNMTVEQLVTVFIGLYIIVVRSAATAAQHGDETARRGLLAFAQREQESINDPMDWKTWVSSQAELIELLADLSGNPLMKLFFTITREILTPHLFDNFVAPKPAKIARARAIRIQLLEAIRDGDPEIAEVFARRYTAVAESWTLSAAAY